jgi:hypothetical protein
MKHNDEDRSAAERQSIQTSGLVNHLKNDRCDIIDRANGFEIVGLYAQPGLILQTDYQIDGIYTVQIKIFKKTRLRSNRTGIAIKLLDQNIRYRTYNLFFRLHLLLLDLNIGVFSDKIGKRRHRFEMLSVFF